MLLTIDLLSYSLRRAGWRRFISTFLLFYSQIILTEFLLGLFSGLYNFSLIAVNLLLSSGLWLFLYRRRGRKFFRSYFANLRQFIPTSKKTARQDPLWLTLGLLALAFVGWIIFLGVIFPVTDFDGNSYHLTYIANLIQNHNLFDAPTSLTWLAGYPKGGEFIQAWSVLITHNDTFADLAQVPFLILGVYALYEIAVRLGAAKNQARFSALLFVFLPIVLNQLKTTYVDVMLCSLFFAGLAMVIRKELSKLDLLLIGVIFSLLISIKSTGLLFVLALLPLLVWNLYRRYGKATKSYTQPLLLMLLPTLFGLYWYIKDFILYGSPIYPFGFKFAGFSIFAGKTFQEFSAAAIQATSLPHGMLQRIWFVWTEQKDWFGCFYNYDTNYAGLGPIWFIILIPSLIISIYLAIKKRNSLYLAITAVIIALFAVYPANYYSRYTIFITALGIFGLSLVLTYSHRLTANIVKSLVLILAVSVIATNFVLCNFAPGVVHDQLKSVLAGSARGAIYSNTPGPAFVFMENKERAGDTVAYSSHPFFIYPLWKPDFSNRVIFVPASNENQWYQQLHAKHVKYVFATVASKEQEWADDRLKNIYKDDLYEIYQAY